MTEADLYLTVLLLACVIAAVLTLVCIGLSRDADKAHRRADRYQQMHRSARAELLELRAQIRASQEAPPAVDPWAAAEAAEVAQARHQAAVLDRALNSNARHLLTHWSPE